MKKYFHSFLTAVTTLALLAGASACQEEHDFLRTIEPATGARVKFYHVAPDAPGIDILLNDKKFSGVNTVPPATPVAVTYFSSFPNLDYGLISPGSTNVKIVPSATPATAVISATVPVEDGKYYSVFAYGLAPTYSALVLTDNLTPADKNQAYVRLVNLVAPSATAAAPSYDLVLNGSVVATNVRPGTASGEFVGVPAIAFGAAAVPVQIRTAGTTTVIASGTLQPYSSKFYTFIARGQLGGTGTRVVALSTSTNR
jgi:hypothetical protein